MFKLPNRHMPPLVGTLKYLFLESSLCKCVSDTLDQINFVSPCKLFSVSHCPIICIRNIVWRTDVTGYAVSQVKILAEVKKLCVKDASLPFVQIVFCRNT